jgi:membrane-bound inhibitor of C-type lysozyme
MSARLSVALVMLAAVTSGTLAADATANYVCEDATRLRATFHTSNDGPGSVDLQFLASGERVSLPQVLSADGGRYAAGPSEFWIKGRRATLKRGNKTTTCETGTKS